MRARRTALACVAALAAASAVVASASSSPSLEFSPGAEYSTPGDYTYSLASGDLNRDGRSDVVAGDIDSEGAPAGFDRTAVLLSGAGRRLSRARDLHFSGSSDVALVDLDGDRNLDVVRIGLLPAGGGPDEYEWRGAVLLGNGRGRFPSRRTFVVPANTDGGDNVDAMAAADFNRDGRRDLAVTESGVDEPGVWVLIGDGGGNFTEMRRYRTTESARDVVVADFNRDRNPDLAVVRLGAVVIRMGDGAGHFPTTASKQSAGRNPLSLVAGDFNRDGAPDLALANAARRPDVRVLLGNGRGGLSDPRRYRVSHPPGSIAFADLDRDGTGDLAVAEIGGRRAALRVLLGDGRGGFRPGERFVLNSPDVGAVVAATANRDRKPDLVIARGYENGVSVLFNDTRG